MKKVFSLFILASVIWMVFALPVLANEQADNNIITAMETRGNLVIPSEEIFRVVKTKVGQKINSEQLKNDLQAVFDLGYFFGVQANFENHLGGVKLIIEVVENPKVTKVEITGTSVIQSDKLLEQFKTQPGQMLNTQVLNADLRAIEGYYEEQGLVLAYIQDVSVSPEGVLSIVINEGFIQEIQIHGNEKTKEYVIRRELSVESGDVFDLNKIQKDRSDVYNLGFFDNVQPRIERATDGSNNVNLIYDVEEKKTGNVQFGGGYSSKDGWLAYLEVKEQNLLGRGQKVGFKWEVGQSTNYELNFYDPWAFGKEFSFGIDLYNTTNRNGKDSENNKYTKHSKGASVQVGKPLTENISGSIKFKYEDTLTSWEDDVKPEEKGDTRSLTLSTVRDTTDNPFSPHIGEKDIASIEYAGQLLGGKYHFTKYNLESSRYFPGFKDDHTWAFRLKGGLGTGELPYHETYKLGGGETLRGYAPGAFSGNKMLLLNAEYRFPVVKSLEGSVFVDAGKTWDVTERVNLNELKGSAGAGLLMNTPLGQIRLGYAWGFGEKSGMPYFGIGQTF